MLAPPPVLGAYGVYAPPAPFAYGTYAPGPLGPTMLRPPTDVPAAAALVCTGVSFGTAGVVDTPAAFRADGDDTPICGALSCGTAGVAIAGEANALAAGTLNRFPSAENACESEGSVGMVNKL
jgi:hypothetical protein